MITVTIGKKALKRGVIKSARFYLQCTDGFWKWREYTPFVATNRAADRAVMVRLKELAESRAREYEQMEHFVQELLEPVEEKEAV